MSAADDEFITWITDDAKWNLLVNDSGARLVGWGEHRTHLPREAWTAPGADAHTAAVLVYARKRLLDMRQTMREKHAPGQPEGSSER